MATQFELDVLAELAALSAAVGRSISGLAAIAATGGMPRREYLGRVLEAGLRDLDNVHYFSVPADQRTDFVENARARFSQIISGVEV